MPLFGHIEQFDEKVCTFSSYINRLNSYFIANSVDDNMKIHVFLSLIGPSLYQQLVNLLAPVSPETKGFDEVVQILESHFNPKRMIIVERYKFNGRCQQPNETMSEYILVLRQLARTCEFGSFLDDALRDRLVCGIRSDGIRKALLREEELSMASATKLALALELADAETQCMASGAETVNSENINKISKVHSFKHNKNLSLFRCKHCGNCRDENTCRAKKWKCFRCGKRGHCAKVCTSAEQSAGGYSKTQSASKWTKGKFTRDEASKLGKSCGQRQIHQIDEDDSSEEENVLYLHHLDSVSDTIGEFGVELEVEGVKVNFQVDTGAAVTVVPRYIFEQKFCKLERKLRRSKLKLRSYTGDLISVCGEIDVKVRSGKKDLMMTLFVVEARKCSVPCLLGRDWIRKLGIDWMSIKINNVEEIGRDLKDDPLVATLVKEFPYCFSDSTGEIKGYEVGLVLKSDSCAKFCKPYTVPYALRDEVEKQLNQMVQSGILSPTKRSQWATPIVTVPKPDGGVRICGDFKKTLNPVLDVAHYPLPHIEDIFANVSGGTVFSVIDLSKAYLQLKVNEDSQKMLVVNTHLGLFRFKRLPYGVSSAPSLFQSVMDSILRGIPKVVCYLDDVLIAGKDYDDCVKKTRLVLAKLNEHQIKVNLKKCQFFRKSVQYVGHILDKNGRHIPESRVEAIKGIPEPTCPKQLRSYLGLVQAYSSYIPRLSSYLKPLYDLLSLKEWSWNIEAQRAFKKSKQLLCNVSILALYNPEHKLVLECDSSRYGLGAVLSQIEKNGGERPIAFASRTLNTAEQNYSQVEKEALALKFGVIRFHKFLYGRQFTLVTDHKPLIYLFGPKKGFPTMSASRLQRWAIVLAAYNFEIVYKKGSEMYRADALSRLPVNETSSENSSAVNYVPFFQGPLTSYEISRETEKDKTLSKVLTLTKDGWPENIRDEELKLYHTRRMELSSESNCVLLGSRVVIPRALRRIVLELLHQEHPGICRMKALARSYVWWPGIDSDITDFIAVCAACQLTQNSNPSSPTVQPWPGTTRPWQRLHIDFACKDGVKFLVVTDSFSKWMEVFIMSRTDADQTISKLRSLFSVFGLPLELVSDNGPPFSSEEFAGFCQGNGIKHVRTPPYHASSNGAAERSVQTLKKCLAKHLVTAVEDKRKPWESTAQLQKIIDNFLFTYRNTPHTVTGTMPAERLLKFRPRTKLSMLRPDFNQLIRHKKETNLTREQPMHGYQPGENVLVRSVRGDSINWWPGTVLCKKGAVLYLVNVRGKTRLCHVDHLKPTKLQDNSLTSNQTAELKKPLIIPVEIACKPPDQEGQQGQHPTNIPTSPPPVSPQSHTPSTNPVEEKPILRRSERIQRKLERRQYK